MKKNIIIVIVLLLIYVCIIMFYNRIIALKNANIVNNAAGSEQKTNDVNNPAGSEHNNAFVDCGIGFVISKDGYLVTAQHIIRGACMVCSKPNSKAVKRVVLYFYNDDPRYRAFSETRSFVAKVAYENTRKDIAFLEIVGRINSNRVVKEALTRIKDSGRFSASEAIGDNHNNNNEYVSFLIYVDKLNQDIFELREKTYTLYGKDIEYQEEIAKLQQEIAQLQQDRNATLENERRSKEDALKTLKELQDKEEKYDFITSIFQEIELDIVRGDSNHDNEFLEKLNPEDVPPLPTRVKDHRPGKMICIPGAIFISPQMHARIPFFMYFARVAGGELVNKKTVQEYFYVYFDKPVHIGMSGAPVINSNGEVIAMINGNTTEEIAITEKGQSVPEWLIPTVPVSLYSKGVSSQTIKDELEKLIKRDEGSKLASDLQKVVNEINSVDVDHAPADDKYKRFPEFIKDDENGIDELKELRKSIAFIKVYSSAPEPDKEDSASDKTE